MSSAAYASQFADSAEGQRGLQIPQRSGEVAGQLSDAAQPNLRIGLAVPVPEAPIEVQCRRLVTQCTGEVVGQSAYGREIAQHVGLAVPVAEAFGDNQGCRVYGKGLGPWTISTQQGRRASARRQDARTQATIHGLFEAGDEVDALGA